MAALAAKGGQFVEKTEPGGCLADKKESQTLVGTPPHIGSQSSKQCLTALTLFCPLQALAPPPRVSPSPQVRRSARFACLLPHYPQQLECLKGAV